MNYILFDDNRTNLLPLTYTRPVAELRIGILTIKDKWEHYLGASPSYKTEGYLQDKYPMVSESINTWINGSVFPNNELVKAIHQLNENEALVNADVLLAYKSHNEVPSSTIKFNAEFVQLSNLWHIFSKNAESISDDFDLITENRTSQKISETNNVIAKENIFLEEGAKVEFATLNASEGPIYIGKNAEIMEGCLVRGSLAMCSGSVLKMGTKIYGGTTLGPFSKVGGEVNNSVFQAFSNKGHDGFLGNAVIGEWCNIGADSNNSNLKNNYAEVKLWSYEKQGFENTGLQFCGLVMGDHSKCGINTMFNTGTVIGVSCNLFGTGFPRNFVPSFSWGGASGYSTFTYKKAVEVAAKVMERRKLDFDQTENDILSHIFDLTNSLRKY